MRIPIDRDAFFMIVHANWDRLARFITAGGEVNGGMANQQLELMLHMVEKYGDFGGAENQSVTNTAASNNEHVVVSSLQFILPKN